MNRDDVFGLEFDWFAVDCDGHIGHFSSAGYGPIPQAVLDQADAQEQLLAYFQEQPKQTDAELMIAPAGTLDDWLAIARQGVFSYDYGVSYGPYQLVARPVHATLISALPAHIQQMIRHVSFEQICFTAAATIHPEQLTAC
jgi:hypothetical protein